MMKKPRATSLMANVSAASLIVSAVSVQGATYYISPSGSDVNRGTEASPYRSFEYAFATMDPGDELILLDGKYSAAAGTGYINHDDSTCPSCGQPKSGRSLSNMTVVRAKTEGNVTIDGGSRAGMLIGQASRKDSYVKIQGILFKGGGALYNCSFCTVKNSGFYSAGQGSGAVFGVGTNDHNDGNTHNLIEDCWIWGKERLIAINYRADFNVWRRVVVRGDGCNSSSCTGAGNPTVGFTIYNSKNVHAQNMMVVDRILGGGTPGGDFAAAQHDSATPETPLQSLEWSGCIVMNPQDQAFWPEADRALSPTYKFSNCAVIMNGANTFGFNVDGYQAFDSVIENCTIVGKTGGTGSLIRFGDHPKGNTIRNCIARGNAENAVVRAEVVKHLNVYGEFSDGKYYGVGSVQDEITTDPLSDGKPPSLKYPLRIEIGSALKGRAQDGADVGANIVYRYGAAGTRYGENGFNSVTAQLLWPWPNEHRIKSEMCEGVTRGFCAGTQSLTDYLWSALGNPNPYPSASEPAIPKEKVERQ